jgi:hypothetical protein
MEIDRNEWYDGYEDIDWFTDWDMDNDDQLAENEFNEMTYDDWDQNDDDNLSQNEFDEGYAIWVY